MALPENPISRNEQYLNRIVTGEGGVPDPVTREDQYLDYIATNGTAAEQEILAILPKKADLNAAGKVPSSQLPSYIDETVEGYFYNDAFYEDAEHTQLITPESATIYVDIPTHRSYRWTGTVYLMVDNENELYVVPVINMSTMGELREYINGINEQGLHVLLDMHTYLSDGYVCTVHMTTESNVQYCEVFDAVNIQSVAKGSYVDTDTITAFVAGNTSKLATQTYVLAAIGLLDDLIGTGVIV